MQRPHPTHPLDSNWSIQAANLCVSHCRYRLAALGRTLPDAMCENSSVKQLDHSRDRLAVLPSSDTESTKS
jgi:hypothetical protein